MSVNLSTLKVRFVDESGNEVLDLGRKKWRVVDQYIKSTSWYYPPVMTYVVCPVSKMKRPK